MLTFILFLLLLLSFVLFIFHYRKLGILFSCITIFLYVICGCGFFSALLLPCLENNFQISPQPQWGKNNVIILLGAGTVKIPTNNVIKPSILAYSRILETAQYYFSCKKQHKLCTILISGGDATQSGQSEALIYSQVLANLGVNKTDMLLEEHSLNTYRNAEYSSQILKTKSFDTVYLVTASIHMARSLLYFSHFGINANALPADYIAPTITLIPIGYNFAISDFITHEYLGIARFHLYNYLGWNTITTSVNGL